MPSGFEGIKTVTINGAQLAYRERGEGEAVVFVHGDLSDLRTWERQLDAIGASHRAVSYSRRYARPNDDIEPGVDNQMLPHVDDLVAFLRTIEATPAHLVGNSWGAFVCLLAAIHHPEVVRSLVLEEPPVLTLFTSPEPRPLELLRLMVTRPRTAAAIVKLGATALAPAQRAFRRDEDATAVRTFARGVLGREYLERLPEDRWQQAIANRSALKAFLLGAGFPPLADDQVRSVTVPTLLVTGADSPAIFLRLTDRLEELLPRAERLDIESSAHLVHHHNPEALNEAVASFIGRATTPRV